MQLLYRKSTSDDYQIINHLLNQCFGDRAKYGALDNLENRYLLAFDNKKLIAMTGLSTSSSSFTGSEIDWTGVLPEYRGQGIITHMISEVIKDYSGYIYCSCLRLYENDKVNLNYAMKHLGFIPVLKNYKRYKYGFTNVCDDCIYKLTADCQCAEDLYLLHKI